MSHHRLCDCCVNVCESGTSIRYFRWRNGTLSFSMTQAGTGTRTSTHTPSSGHCDCGYGITEPVAGDVVGTAPYGLDAASTYEGTVSSSVTQDLSVSGGLAIATSDLGLGNEFDPATETGTVTFPDSLNETENGADNIDTDTFTNGWACPDDSGSNNIGRRARVVTTGACRFEGSGFALDRTSAKNWGASGTAWAAAAAASGLDATTFADTVINGFTAKDVDAAASITEAAYDIEILCDFNTLTNSTSAGVDYSTDAAGGLVEDLGPTIYIRLALTPSGAYSGFAIIRGGSLPSNYSTSGSTHDETLTSDQPTASISLSVTGLLFDSNNCVNQADIAVSGSIAGGDEYTAVTPLAIEDRVLPCPDLPDPVFDWEDDAVKERSVSSTFSFSIRVQAF